MDTEKIGKFIAECRKKKQLTQEQLATKLNVTDRAVSKWERGLSIPDASIMLELSNILDITVNELLTGEKIAKKDIEKISEELILEFAKEKEAAAKKVIFIEQLVARNFILFIIALSLACSSFIENEESLIIVCGIIVFFTFLISMTILKLESDFGYYECKICNHKHKPNYKTVLLATHIGTKRKIKCPNCHKKTWHKKVFK